jgi:hypothetical protein
VEKADVEMSDVSGDGKLLMHAYVCDVIAMISAVGGDMWIVKPDELYMVNTSQ